MSKISKINYKFLLSSVIAVMFLVIGFLGGSWEQAFATTTIPIVDTITPSQIEVNSPDTQFLIEGADFIGEWGTEWTLIRWKGPDGQIITVHPDQPDFVWNVGKEIYVTFPESLFTQVGVAMVEVINHPEDPELIEISQPLYVTITGDNYIYLPLIMK
jgi:hypothetical protein